jgi:hypothetical protein
MCVCDVLIKRNLIYLWYMSTIWMHCYNQWVFYVVYRKMSNAFAMSWRVQVSFWFDDDVRFALDRHTNTLAVVRFRVLANWNNRPQINMLPYTDTLYPDSKVTCLSSCSYMLRALLRSSKYPLHIAKALLILR